MLFDYAILLFYGLLIFLPSVAMWRSFSRQTSGLKPWLHRALALLGPSVAIFVLSVLMSLPGYSGRCGGWLGETSPCTFRKYISEQVDWVEISQAIPALIGILLGIVVLAIGLIKTSKKG